MHKKTDHPLHRLFHKVWKWYMILLFLLALCAGLFWRISGESISFSLLRIFCVLISTFPGVLLWCLDTLLAEAEQKANAAGLQISMQKLMSAAFVDSKEGMAYLISKKVHHNIKEDILWTVLFTLVCVPFTSGYLYALGGALPDITLSCLILLLNSGLLYANYYRFKKYNPMKRGKSS